MGALFIPRRNSISLGRFNVVTSDRQTNYLLDNHKINPNTTALDRAEDRWPDTRPDDFRCIPLNSPLSSILSPFARNRMTSDPPTDIPINLTKRFYLAKVTRHSEPSKPDVPARYRSPSIS